MALYNVTGSEDNYPAEAIIEKDNTSWVDAPTYFGWKAEHTTENIAQSADDLIFSDARQARADNEEFFLFLADNVFACMTELDYENGNHYWMPDADVEEAIEAVLSDEDAPEGIREWYESI